MADVLARREAEIMTVLWNLGQASADQVREALPEDLHDSTVRTLLRILEKKGFVSHKVQGRSYIYRPAIQQSKVQKGVIASVVDRFFGGSPERLLLHMIEEKHLSLEDLERLRQGPEKRRQRRKAGDS